MRASIKDAFTIPLFVNRKKRSAVGLSRGHGPWRLTRFVNHFQCLPCFPQQIPCATARFPREAEKGFFMIPATSRMQPACVGMAALLLPLLASPAEAHVKWFAPYIVAAPPRPIFSTLADPWFWTGIILVLVFFLATRAVEKTAFGETVLR